MLFENETTFSLLQLLLDVMGIVRDRQEPCTCETYNGQVGPSSDYNKEAPDSFGQVPQQRLDLPYSQRQGEAEGLRMPGDQNESLNQQLRVSYQNGNNNRGSQSTWGPSDRPEGDEQLSYGQSGDQPLNALKKPANGSYLSEKDYANQQDNDYRQKLGEERPFSNEQQQSRLHADQNKAVDEKANREGEKESIGSDGYSTNPTYSNKGQNERLKNSSFQRANEHMHSPETHRFAAGFPEHYKPQVNGDDDQGSGSEQENKQSSKSQKTDDQEGYLFPSSAVNQERVQGSASHVHPAFIPPSGIDFHGRPFAQPNYPQSSSIGQDEFLSDHRRPTKFIAVDKAVENANTGAQQQNHRGEIKILNSNDDLMALSFFQILFRLETSP